MLNYQGESISLVNQKVQKQSNSNDCGLFAIAFATTLCHGGNPSKTRYDQTALKKHLVNCLESLEVTLFPETSTQVPWHTTVGHNTIYCLCRMPNDKTEYVQCAGCDDWYHPRCARSLPQHVIQKESGFAPDVNPEDRRRAGQQTSLV